MPSVATGQLECNVCRRHFNVKYWMIPMDDKARNGVEVPLYLPEEIIMGIIQAQHKYEIAMLLPNPSEREKKEDKDWFEKLSPENQRAWIADTRAKIEPVWPAIAEWFGGVPSYAGAMRRKDAVNLLQEIAIPSLKHCEEKYGHDDAARLNLEAGLGMTNERS